jgi:hypothetical protein
MSVFRDGAEAETVVLAFLQRYLASDDGAAVQAQAGLLDAAPVLELRLVEPDAVVHVDFGARQAARGAAPEEPGAVAEIRADDLHDLLLDRLGPVEISRLGEEGRVRLEGPPQALAALLVLAGRIQPHYPASLAEQGREDLLATPAPEVGVMWGNDDPPPHLIGVRRQWQRPKGAAAAT